MFLVMNQGVKVDGLSPEIVLALMVASTIFASERLNLIVTSCVDGKHMTNSLHYKGHGVDLRLRSEPRTRRRIVDALKMALTDEYDVVLESDHIHIEFDPK